MNLLSFLLVVLGIIFPFSTRIIIKTMLIKLNISCFLHSFWVF